MSLFEYEGNVRELRSKVLGLSVRLNGDIRAMIDHALTDGPLTQAEIIRRLLERHDDNRSYVARILGMSQSSFNRLAEKLGV